jgi:hypothetical protein
VELLDDAGQIEGDGRQVRSFPLHKTHEDPALSEIFAACTPLVRHKTGDRVLPRGRPKTPPIDQTVTRQKNRRSADEKNTGNLQGAGGRQIQERSLK